MSELPPSALSSAAETRRRELPATVALVILTGGLGAAILGHSGAVAWAAAMAALLIADATIYRRLDAAEAAIEGDTQRHLAVWAFFTSAGFAVLPAALWIDGQAAGAAAAMVLWVAGVVRHVGRGAPNAVIAAAGAAPPALLILLAPLAMALSAQQPDWDVSVIAAVGGGALMIYVAQARVGAAEAERALRAAAGDRGLQNKLAELLLDQGAVSAFLLDPQGCVLAMSNRAKAGLAVGDIVGRRFEDACPWVSMRWRDAFRRALDGESVICDEEEVLTPNGVRALQWEVRPWRSESGVLCGAMVYGRDISAMVEARRAISANEERLRIALDAGRGIVWEVDFRTRTISWFGDPAPIFGRMFSYEEFITRSTAVLLEEDRPAINARFEAAMLGETQTFEHRVQKPDGEIMWVQSWVKPQMGRSGAVSKFIMLTKDVTARKREEGAFLEAMSRAEAALKAKRALITDAVVDDDAPADALHNVSVAEMFERLRTLLEEMDTRDAVLAEMVISLRAAREAAEDASIAKSQFLASMSHELRTPLNAIIGYSEILLEEAEADGRDTDKKDIERVLASARHLLHLINDILDLSKIEAGRLDVAIADFDVASLISEAVATVRPAADRNGNIITIDVSGKLGMAQNDAFKLNQCLLNLLSNASKFTKDGEIVVRGGRVVGADGADWLEISVKDSGIGMTDEQMSRLFQAFVQAEATTSRRFGGTGLGLAITQRVMKLLGGDVRVVSKLGEGSTFTLRFPARLGQVATPALTERVMHEGDGRGFAVLVIDDEESARDLAARSISRLGFAMRQASTARDGLDAARRERPSVIVLDINLPDQSGWELMETLAADPKTAGVPVIVHSVDDDRQRAISLGASAHLVKPADRDVLAATVARIVRPQQSQTQVSEPAAVPAHSSLKTA